MKIGKTERIIAKQLGKKWSRLADDMKKNVPLTKKEDASEFAKDIMRAKERYYAKALKLILKCAKKKSQS
jgi:hypothetical protein